MGGKDKQLSIQPKDAEKGKRLGTRRPTDPGAPSYREIVDPKISPPKDTSGIPESEADSADQRDVVGVPESGSADLANTRREVAEPQSLPKNTSDSLESEAVPEDKRDLEVPESSQKNPSGDPESEAVSADKREVEEPESSTQNTSGDPESEGVPADKRESVESEIPPENTSGAPESEANFADKREQVEPECSHKPTTGISKFQAVPAGKPISRWDEIFYALIYSGRNWFSPYSKNLYFPGSVSSEQINLPATEMADNHESHSLFSAALECWNDNSYMSLNPEHQSTAASSSMADDRPPDSTNSSATAILSADNSSHMDQLFGDNPFRKQS